MTERYLSLPEAADELGISEPTVRRWVKSGRLLAFKPGRDYKVPESAVRELILESRVVPKGERRSQFEPTFNDVLEEERRRDEMPGWARAGLEKSAFVERFEAAKRSEEAAYQLHREEIASLERAEAKPGALHTQNVAIAKARATATAFLWAELLRGRDVAAVDPVEIVAGVIEAQQELFSAEEPDEGSASASGAASEAS